MSGSPASKYAVWVGGVPSRRVTIWIAVPFGVLFVNMIRSPTSIGVSMLTAMLEPSEASVQSGGLPSAATNWLSA